MFFFWYSRTYCYRIQTRYDFSVKSHAIVKSVFYTGRVTQVKTEACPLIWRVHQCCVLTLHFSPMPTLIKGVSRRLTAVHSGEELTLRLPRLLPLFSVDGAQATLVTLPTSDLHPNTAQHDISCCWDAERVIHTPAGLNAEFVFHSQRRFFVRQLPLEHLRPTGLQTLWLEKVQHCTELRLGPWTTTHLGLYMACKWLYGSLHCERKSGSWGITTYNAFISQTIASCWLTPKAYWIQYTPANDLFCTRDCDV